MYRITATDGQSSDTLVITDLSTGTVVKNPALTDVDVRFRTGHPIIANGTVEVIRPDLEVMSFDWLTRHPITDQLAPLAAMEFRDGARIEFQDNGAPVVKPAASAGEPPTVTTRSETVTMTLNFEAPDLLHSVAKALFGDDVPAPAADLTTLEMSEVIAFQLRRRATNAGASLDDFWSVLRSDGIGSHAAPKGMVWVGDLGPEVGRPVSGPMGITPYGGIARNYGAFADGLIPGEVGELPPSNLIKVASVLIEPALGGAFNVQGSDPLAGEFRTDLESALNVAVRWLAAGEMVPEFETAGVQIGKRLSVIIDRYQDPDGKDCYAASTSAGADGYAHGISAVTGRPDWTSEESLAGVLDFARQHLAPAPGESGEVPTTTAGA